MYGMRRGGGISSAPLSPPLPPNKQCLDPYTPPTSLSPVGRRLWRRGGCVGGDGRVLRPLGGICNQEEEEELRNVDGRTDGRTDGVRSEE